MEQKQTKSDKKERSKETALPILACTPDYSEAARLIGCARSEIYVWLKDDEFKSKLEGFRSLVVDDAVSKMKAHATKAVDTLAALLDDDNPQIRRGASNDILNHISKYIELKEIATRLSNIEKTMKIN
jgi:hypothetical protein